MDNISDNSGYAPTEGNPSYPPQRIKVIGVGGGGNNAVNHMYNLGVRNVTFIVANTDKQALENSPVPTKVLLGPNTLRGRGAGNDPERAREAAEESVDEVTKLFDSETDMVFITAGMGGGTGTGASPVIARVAREYGLLTIGIVTIPFFFEGEKKILKALQGAEEMSKYVDALLVINNERLSEIYRDYDFLNAFGKADDILSMAAISISEIITCDGYINLDFNDVDRTLRNGGTAIISTGYGEGENRVTKAIEDALDSPLLRNTDIYGSKKLLFNLYFSRDAEETFKIDETRQITEFISNIHRDVDVIWGVGFDESLGNKVKFTILAAGFDVTINDSAKIQSPEETRTTPQRPPHTDTRRPPVPPVKPTPQSTTVDTETIMRVYGEDKGKELEQMRDQNRYMVLKQDEMDQDEAIAVLNERPALNRDKSTMRRDSSRQSNSTSGTRGGGSIDFDDV